MAGIRKLVMSFSSTEATTAKRARRVELPRSGLFEVVPALNNQFIMSLSSTALLNKRPAKKTAVEGGVQPENCVVSAWCPATG